MHAAVERFFDELRAGGERRVSIEIGTESTVPGRAGTRRATSSSSAVSARPVKYAAAPMLTLDLQVSESPTAARCT